MLQFILTLLLLLVKLDRSLTRFPVDTILGILLGESYSGIRALVDLSVCVDKYQHSLIVVPEPGHYYIGLRALGQRPYFSTNKVHKKLHHIA